MFCMHIWHNLTNLVTEVIFYETDYVTTSLNVSFFGTSVLCGITLYALAQLCRVHFLGLTKFNEGLS